MIHALVQVDGGDRYEYECVCGVWLHNNYRAAVRVFERHRNPGVDESMARHPAGKKR